MAGERLGRGMGMAWYCELTLKTSSLFLSENEEDQTAVL
jgi:hypothetical protein